MVAPERRLFEQLEQSRSWDLLRLTTRLVVAPSRQDVNRVTRYLQLGHLAVLGVEEAPGVGDELRVDRLVDVSWFVLDGLSSVATGQVCGFFRRDDTDALLTLILSANRGASLTTFSIVATTRWAQSFASAQCSPSTALWYDFINLWSRMIMSICVWHRQSQADSGFAVRQEFGQYLVFLFRLLAHGGCG